MNKPLKTGVLTLLAASALVVNAAAVSGTGASSASPVRPGAANFTESAVVTTVTRDTPLLLSPADADARSNYSYGNGYIYARYLALSDAPDMDMGYGMILPEKLSIYARPSEDSLVLEACEHGDIVHIIGVSNQWLHVEFSDCTGYVENANVEFGHAKDEYGPCETMCYVTAPGVSLYSSPAPEAEEALLSCGRGDRLELLSAENDGWYKVRVDDTVAYASSASLVTYPADENGTGADIVSWAMTFIGTPYVYGGTSPAGFDCSGFVYYLYQGSGYNISRRASTIWYDGYSISKDELKPGDPVFFSNPHSSSIEHVGLYVGEGLFIHSPTTGKSVQLDTLESGYYAREYYGAVRIYGTD